MNLEDYESCHAILFFYTDVLTCRKENIFYLKNDKWNYLSVILEVSQMAILVRKACHVAWNI